MGRPSPRDNEDLLQGLFRGHRWENTDVTDKLGRIKVLETNEEVPTGFGPLYDAPDPPEDVVYLHERNVSLLRRPDLDGRARAVTIILGSGMRDRKRTMEQCFMDWMLSLSYDGDRFRHCACDVVVYYDDDPGDANVNALADTMATSVIATTIPEVHRVIIHRLRNGKVHILHSPPRWQLTAPAPGSDREGLAKILEERIRTYLDRDLDLLGRGARASECKYSLGASGGSSDAPSRRMS